MGGAGARGVRVLLRPPPGVAVPSWGGGRPLGSGGAEGRRSCGSQAGGGAGGGGGGAALLLPAPLPSWVARGPRSCHPLSPARPPGAYSCCGGCRAAVGVGHGPVGRQWVSAAGGGRGGGE